MVKTKNMGKWRRDRIVARDSSLKLNFPVFTAVAVSWMMLMTRTMRVIGCDMVNESCVPASLCITGTLPHFEKILGNLNRYTMFDGSGDFFWRKEPLTHFFLFRLLYWWHHIHHQYCHCSIQYEILYCTGVLYSGMYSQYSTPGSILQYKYTRIFRS